MVKNSRANAEGVRDEVLIPESGRSPGGGMATHSSILAWGIHGQRSLAGYTVHRVAEWDMNESI